MYKNKQYIFVTVFSERECVHLAFFLAENVLASSESFLIKHFVLVLFLTTP